MRDGNHGLENNCFQIKSYGFAQPKPGNLGYSQDLSSITYRNSNAIVINNTKDIIPMVPLTIQQPHEVLQNLITHDIVPDTVQRIHDELREKTRAALASTHIHSILQHTHIPNFLNEILAYQGDHNSEAGHSYNYVLCGFLVPLIGRDNYTWLDGVAPDTFIQHHAPTYRELLNTECP
jgi:hypothetical protein